MTGIEAQSIDRQIAQIERQQLERARQRFITAICGIERGVRLHDLTDDERAQIVRAVLGGEG